MSDKDRTGLTEFERGMIARYGTKKYTQSELDREVAKAVESKKQEWQREAREEGEISVMDWVISAFKNVPSVVPTHQMQANILTTKFEMIKSKYLTQPSKEADHENK